MIGVFEKKIERKLRCNSSARLDPKLATPPPRRRSASTPSTTTPRAATAGSYPIAAIYRDDAPHIELQKFDDPKQGPPKFRDDREAWSHVVARARAGSALHIRALDLVDRRERFAIEAAFGPW